MIGPRAAHAGPTPTNVIRNSSFEGGLYIENVSGVQTRVPASWSFETCEGVPNAVENLDQNQWTDRLNSTRVWTGPLSTVGCGLDPSCTHTSCPNRGVGFSQFRQSLPGFGYNFTDLTDGPAGFSFWFQLQPYNITTGMAAFEIRIFGVESGAELDYYINADPSIGQGSNSTSVHSIYLSGYQFGQWYHFSRNLRADWLTPMGPANTPLNLNYNLTLVQFQGFATKSGSVYKSEILWIDDVRLYVGPGSVPLETHYTSFSLTDSNNNPANNVVQWALTNASGAVPYTLGQSTLTPGPYFVQVYYPTVSPNNLILKQQIRLDQSSIITLSLYPSNIVSGGHVALDRPATSVTIASPDSSRSLVDIRGPTGTVYNAIVDVPSKPVLIQANGQTMTEGYDWTFDSSLSILRTNFAMPAAGENLTILFQNSALIPTLSFVDRTDSPVDSVTFNILDSQGNPVPYMPGAVLPPGNHYLEVYYEGSRIYRDNVANIGNPKVILEMLALDSLGNYIALNSTATSITPSEYSSTQVKFSIAGPGPYLVVVNVPKRPIYVEVNGVRTPDWVYNNTTKTVTVNNASAGTFLLVLEQPSPFNLAYLFGGIAVAGAAAVLGAYYWRRKQTRLNPPRNPKLGN